MQRRSASPEPIPCACPLCVSPVRVPGACPPSVLMARALGPGAGRSVPGCSGDHPIAAAWPMAFAIVNALLAENSDMIEGGAVVWRGEWPDRFECFRYHVLPFVWFPLTLF